MSILIDFLKMSIAPLGTMGFIVVMLGLVYFIGRRQQAKRRSRRRAISRQRELARHEAGTGLYDKYTSWKTKTRKSKTNTQRHEQSRQ